MKALFPLAALLSITALAPCTARASWVELSDADLRAIQGRGFVADPSLFPQQYRATLNRMWTGLTTYLRCIPTGRPMRRPSSS